LGRRLAEGGASEDPVLVADFEGTIQEVVQADTGTPQRYAGAACLDAVEIAAGAKRECFGQDLLLAPCQDFIQSIVCYAPGAVGRRCVTRRGGEPCMPHGHELRREGLGTALIQEMPGQPHLLDEAVLQRLVGPLDTALGLRWGGVDQRNVETFHNAAKLGRAGTAHGILGLDLGKMPFRWLCSAMGRACAGTWAFSASRSAQGWSRLEQTAALSGGPLHQQ